MGFRLPNSRLQRAKESLIYKVQSSLLISLIGVLTACEKGPSGESLLLIADLAQGQRGDPCRSPCQVSCTQQISGNSRQAGTGKTRSEKQREADSEGFKPWGKSGGSQRKGAITPQEDGVNGTHCQAQRGNIRNVSDSRFTGRESLLVGPSPVV